MADSVHQVSKLTGIDPWFLSQLAEITDKQIALEHIEAKDITAEQLRDAKRMGFSDQRLATEWKLGNGNEGVLKVREMRKQMGIVPVFKRVDTCAAEFESFTPYMYSTYEEEDESAVTSKKKVIILGSGPNRIGQGIEFDYCCCHAAFALRDDGFETIMVELQS